MYCINCGVELADSEERCPLCGTLCYHPEISRETVKGPYPAYIKEEDGEAGHSGLLFVLSILFLLPLTVCLICDLRISGHVSWSGYVAGGILLAYIIGVLPLWFRKPNPIVLTAIDFAFTGLYLYYINWNLGGSWFFAFVLPMLVAGMALAEAGVLMLRFWKEKKLYIYGIMLIGIGFFTAFVEILINRHFGINDVLQWSFYPLLICCILGAGFIILGKNKKLRDSLHKKLFF